MKTQEENCEKLTTFLKELATGLGLGFREDVFKELVALRRKNQLMEQYILFMVYLLWMNCNDANKLICQIEVSKKEHQSTLKTLDEITVQHEKEQKILQVRVKIRIYICFINQTKPNNRKD